MSDALKNYTQRKIMWGILSKLFAEKAQHEFVWMFSKEDRMAHYMDPDGVNMRAYGACRHVNLVEGEWC